MSSYVITVIDSTLTAPPGGEAHGDTYIVGPAATGDWSGHDYEMAVFLDGVWTFNPAADGTTVWDAGVASIKLWDQTLWREVGTQAPNVTILGIDVSVVPTEAEVQTIADKLDELILAIISSGIMAP